MSDKPQQGSVAHSMWLEERLDALEKESIKNHHEFTQARHALRFRADMAQGLIDVLWKYVEKFTGEEIPDPEEKNDANK